MIDQTKNDGGPTNPLLGVTIHVQPEDPGRPMSSFMVKLAVNGQIRHTRKGLSPTQIPEAITEALKNGTQKYMSELNGVSSLKTALGNFLNVFQ